MANDTQIAMTGLPDDRGVKNNNGRPGAAGGPDAFRTYFNRLNGKNPVHGKTKDLGDIPLRDSIRDSHEETAQIIRKHQQTYGHSLIIGGGHDYAFPHLNGVKQSLGDDKILGCINLDAHFDLRSDKPMILSGSPFYMAIENKAITGDNLVEFGIQRHCNASSLWDYAGKHNVKTYRMENLRSGRAVQAFEQALNYLSRNCDAIVISLDLDAVDGAFAPGVSAPAAEGFYPSGILDMILMSARERKVVSLGIYELNPEFDQDNRTARLAAVSAYHFVDEKFA